ncbi:MAG: hypothetical protein QM723_03390 [Myxococcaceae bacterium]
MDTEIVQRAAHAIASQPLHVAIALGGGAAAIAAERLLRRSVRLPRFSFEAAIMVAVGVALGLTWKTLWLCDDAFISFRYAQNLAAGNGLVFNVGEWVEGYTNFLWTATLGGLARFGVSIPHAALALDGLSLAAVVVVAALAVRKAAPGPVALPFAAMVLACSHPFTTYGSSGLETMPATALVVAATLMLVSERELAAGALLTCAALCRPDHLLFAPAMGMAVVAEDLYFSRRLQLRRYARLAAPSIVFLIYYLLRWKAYGDFFPNTYYAKSGGSTYYSQGAVYLHEFLAASGGWLWVPFAFSLCLCRPKSPRELRLRVFAVLGTLGYGFYIVRVGGDFMQYRFLIVVMPLVAIASEVLVRWRLEGARLRRALPLAAAATLAISAWVIPVSVITWQEKWRHIAAEETFYSVTSVFPLKIDSGLWQSGEGLRAAFSKRGVRPKLADGCVGMLGFLTGVPMVDLYGLTNRNIAHLPLTTRGRPGHEKFGGLDEALAEGAIVSMQPLWPDWKDQTRVTVDGNELFLVHYDADFITALSHSPGATVPKLEAQLGLLLAEERPEKIRPALHFYRRFLSGTELLKRLEDRLGIVADFEKAEDPAQATEPFQIAAEADPMPGDSNHVLTSIGHRGAGSTRVHAAALRPGKLRFVIRATTSQASVALEVDGKQVAVVTPEAPGLREPHRFEIDPAWVGHDAQLVITDLDPAETAGLEVDDFHWSRERRPLPGKRDSADLYRALLDLEDEVPKTDPEYTTAFSRLVTRWSFDGADFGSPVERSGDAFGGGPVDGALGSQTPIFGVHGERFANSYHGGDPATGELRLPLGPAQGKTVGLLVGGGSNCKETYAAVLVAGSEVARACGKSDEVLRPFAVELPASEEPAELRVVDKGTGGWGHILIDEVTVLEAGAAEDRPAIGSTH